MGPETRTRQGADHQNQRKGWNATDGVAVRLTRVQNSRTGAGKIL